MTQDYFDDVALGAARVQRAAELARDEARAMAGVLDSLRRQVATLEAALAGRAAADAPIPLLLACPMCLQRHIDEGEFSTKAHHTHVCQECGFVWRPALVPTVGVKFLPGFKNAERGA